MKKFCPIAMLRVEIESIRNFGSYDWENSFMTFIPCCKKANQPIIDRVPLSELKNKSFYEICVDAWKKGPPVGFDTSVDEGCMASVCDWTDTELEKIEVCFSTACNAQCSFCGQSHKYVEGLEDLYYKCLEDLSHSPIRQIGLTVCGEPFFNKKRVFNFLENMDITRPDRSVTIKTNLLSLAEEDAKRIVEIAQNKYWIEVSCSINGINKEVVDSVQNVYCNFDRLVKVASILYDAKVLTGISCVILPETKWQLPILRKTWNIYHNGLGDIVFPLVDLSNRNGNAYKVINSKEWKEYFNGRDVKTGLDV